MNEYSKQIFNVREDLIIDLHYNPNLFKNPYLLRLYSWNDYSEHRLEKEDIESLSNLLTDFIKKHND